MTAGIGRRRVVAGSAGLGLATPLLAACGADGGADSAGDPASSSGGGSSGGADGADRGGGGGALGSTADVPVGGGTIFGDEQVVVTQPAEGDFKAFSSVCTHQGCQVGKVENGQILCPCHGSAFAVDDGSVTTGPATAPLEEVAIAIDGDQITLA